MTSEQANSKFSEPYTSQVIQTLVDVLYLVLAMESSSYFAPSFPENIFYQVKWALLGHNSLLA